MIGSNPRGPIPENGGSSSEETAWELRPGGMLVQKRDDEQQGGADGFIFTIRVSHGSNLHELSVPSNSTFGDLKKIIAQEIGMEPQIQKLFFRGKEKDDRDYLQMAGVKDNSKLLLLEDTRDREISSKEMKETREISIGGAAVAEVKSDVDKFAEKVTALQAGVYGGSKIDEKDIIYLTEMLMRQLLKLDTIEAGGEAKMQRKMEVRRVQSLVETMDALKARNSNSFSDQSNVVSVTTEWEKFDSGVGSLSAPTSMPHSTEVTQDWEHFD